MKYARCVAEHFHTDHTEFIVKPQFIDILPKIVRYYDQPYADTSALPSYLICEFTRKHVTVALNGDGGDENFGGYLRYKALKGSKYASLPFRLLGKGITHKLTSLLPRVETTKPKSLFRYMNRLFSALAEPPEIRNVIWHSFFTNDLKYSIYSQDMYNQFKDNDSYRYLADVFLKAPAKNILDRSFYTDVMTYLPECLLVKMDIAALANSLETRAPFLDQKMFEFTSSLPPNWKLHGFTTKYILKETFKNLLPEQILHRGKQGFGIPVGKWFRYDWKDYARDILLSQEAVSRGYFKKDALRKLLDDHINGYSDYGYCLWALLVLELWHQSYIDK